MSDRSNLMVIWTLAKKDLRVLVRDLRAMMILLFMPLILILVLGISLGEGFGKKPSQQLRVSILNLDEGVPRLFDKPAMVRAGMGWFAALPVPGGAGHLQLDAAAALALANEPLWFPHEDWSQLLLKDLAESGDIRVELMSSREQAEELVRDGRRAAVLIIGRRFSKRVQRCSFLVGDWNEALTFAGAFPMPGNPAALTLRALFQEEQHLLPLYLLQGINPFYRDGIRLETIDVEVLRDPTQQTASAIIDQVAQGSLLRVVLPWMIGRAFEKISDPEFLTLLGKERTLPAPVQIFLNSPFVTMEQKRTLSIGLQNALQNLFPRYNLTGKTWPALTKEREHAGSSGKTTQYQEEGRGWLKRGAARYQLLVPSSLVTFAFFLTLTVGWIFVAERRQGTMKRLRAAPLRRWQILLGKLLPCFFVSLFQGFFLLLAGKVVFDMSWGPAPLWLVPVVLCTSLAAMGLAMLVAALARTETQVAIYGTLLVLVLAGLSGSLMGDRALWSESMQRWSRFTPQAWALDAYRQLLANPGTVDFSLIMQACAVLMVFGAGFVVLAWMLLKLE